MVARAAMLALALAIASAPIAAARDAAAPALKLSVAVGPALPLGKAAERWASRLADDARLVVEVHAGASLAGRDPAREVLAVARGDADLAVGSALQWSLQLPALGVFALPWIAPTDAALARLVADDRLREVLAARLVAAGLTLVDLAPFGHRELATLAQPVRAPEDAAGLKVRAAPLPMLHELLLALDARPQAMSFAELQAALGAGRVDAQEGTPTTLAAARLGARGFRHLTEWGAVADAMVFAVRTPIWDALDDGQRDGVRRAARQAIDDADVAGREAAALRQLSAQGVSIVRLTPAGHAAYRARVAEVTRRWRATVGEDVAAAAEHALRGTVGSAR